MLRIQEIKLRPGEDISSIPDKIKKKLRIREDITEWEIICESVDARNKKDIRLVYTVDFAVKDEESLLKKMSAVNTAKKTSIISKSEKHIYRFPYKRSSCGRPDLPSADSNPVKPRPIIAGMGPAGLFSGLVLARNGFSPIIIERGRPVDERVRDVDRFWDEGILDPESNVQFGEGGAGTFSDGKLTTGVNDRRIDFILDEFVRAGADPAISYRAKPHIGTDILRSVVKNISQEIISAGGDIRYGTRLDDIHTDSGRITGITVCASESREKLNTDHVILGIGHSARDTFAMLKSAGIMMEQKPFSMGVRIEHPQAMIDDAQYGDFAEILPHAEYKLSCRTGDGRGAYTFCMCPGGYVIAASSEPEKLAINGMSYNDRAAEYANSAILVDVRTNDLTGDDPLAGIEFQRKYEKIAFDIGKSYKAPSETLEDFRSKDSILKKCLPAFVYEGICDAVSEFGKRLQRFDDPKARITAVESRSSSPVRLLRDDAGESNIKGLFPCGEGAGYAGGIMSSAVDGLKTAEKVAEKMSDETCTDITDISEKTCR